MKTDQLIAALVADRTAAPFGRRLVLSLLIGGLISLGLFLASAVIEGAITLGAVHAIERLSPGRVAAPVAAGSRVFGAVAIAAVILVAGGVLIASAAPDGIEKLAAQAGLTAYVPAWLHSPLADYQAGFVQSAWLRRAAGGLAGLISIYASCALLGRVIGRQRRP